MRVAIWSVPGDTMRVRVTKNHKAFQTMIDAHPQMKFIAWAKE